MDNEYKSYFEEFHPEKKEVLCVLWEQFVTCITEKQHFLYYLEGFADATPFTVVRKELTFLILLVMKHSDNLYQYEDDVEYVQDEEEDAPIEELAEDLTRPWIQQYANETPLAHPPEIHPAAVHPDVPIRQPVDENEQDRGGRWQDAPPIISFNDMIRRYGHRVEEARMVEPARPRRTTIDDILEMRNALDDADVRRAREEGE